MEINSSLLPCTGSASSNSVLMKCYGIRGVCWKQCESSKSVNDGHLKNRTNHFLCMKSSVCRYSVIFVLFRGHAQAHTWRSNSITFHFVRLPRVKWVLSWWAQNNVFRRFQIRFRRYSVRINFAFGGAGVSSAYATFACTSLVSITKQQHQPLCIEECFCIIIKVHTITTVALTHSHGEIQLCEYEANKFSCSPVRCEDSRFRPHFLSGRIPTVVISFCFSFILISGYSSPSFLISSHRSSLHEIARERDSICDKWLSQFNAKTTFRVANSELILLQMMQRDAA